IVFFFQAEDGIRDRNVTGVQTCALPILHLYSDFLLIGADVNADVGGLHIGNMIIMIIFFIALLAILKKVAWGPLMNVVEERENVVANEIDLAEKNLKEAEEANAKANAQLNETQEEAQKRIADAKAAGEKQQADIIETARQEATRIKTTATEDIQNEKEKAMQELQDQVASLSVLVASKVIEKEIDLEDQEA